MPRFATIHGLRLPVLLPLFVLFIWELKNMKLAFLPDSLRSVVIATSSKQEGLTLPMSAALGEAGAAGWPLFSPG